MADFGRLLVFVGGLLLIVGIVLIVLGKTNLPIGRLPGDIIYRGKNTTVYFPLVVEGAMLIEPTESVGRQDLDAFIEAMKEIDREASENPQLVVDAPHSTRIGRLDEATAARKPVLRWKPDMESTAKAA